MGFLIGAGIFAAGFLICFNPKTKMTSDKEDWERTKKWLLSKHIWGPGDEQKEIKNFLQEFDEEDRAVIERLCLSR